MTPKNETAFSRKASPEPAAAMISPPNAGPMARATLKPAEFHATPAAKLRGETTSGVMACHAGSFSTAPKPIRQVSTSSRVGVILPASVSPPRAAAASTIQLCVNSNSLRRSTMSASAPAGSTTTNTAMLPAACTRPTINGDMVSEVISQAAPTFCIQLPV